MKKKACYEDQTTGLLYAWPVKVEESEALCLPRYTDLAGCRRCEETGSLPGPKTRYVTGECVGCLHADVPHILAAWQAGAPGAPPVLALSREEAARKGVDYFIGGDPQCSPALICYRGAHLRLTSLVTGRCLTCKTPERVAIPSPRKVARRAGHRYYTPETACPDCGQVAPRDVVTNRCTGCVKHGRARKEVVGDARTTAASRMAAECPDLVLARKDAKALGLAVYRTGEPCAHGHTGYRYVSTGACIACLRARPRPLKA